MNSLTDKFRIAFHHISLDGMSFLRGFFQQTHISDTRQTHMQCSGNGRCRQCQHIHIFPESLQFFLMGHTKALFFVYDDQTKVFEFHIFGQDTVGTDENFRIPFFHILQAFLLLFRCTETGKQFNFDFGISRHSLGKSVVMLLGKDGGRHKECHLFAFHCRLECRTDGNFRLAITYVTADESVHDLAAFHILFHIFNGIQLVICFFEGEVFFKFLLPYGICTIFMAFCRRAFRIQGNQILRHDLHSFSGFGFGLRPVLTAQFVQFWRSRTCTDIFLHHIHLVDRHKQATAIPIGNFHIILLDTFHRNLFQTSEHTDTMVIVYHIITDTQVCKTFNGRAIFLAFFLSFLILAAKQFTVTEYGKVDKIIPKTFGKGTFCYPNRTFWYFFIQIVNINCFQPHIPQFFRNASGSGSAACKDKGAEVFFLQILQFFHKKVCSLLERRGRTDRKIRHAFRMEVRRSLAQTCQKHRCKAIHLLQDIGITIEHMTLAGQQIALLDSTFDRFLIFLCQNIHMFANTLRLIDTKDGFFIQIRKQADGFLIKIIHIGTDRCQGMFRAEQFRILTDMFL